MAKKGKKVQASSGKKTKKGVIYVGHVPRPFVERGLVKFFSQFGEVTRVKLARSKKTGNPKGYAFIEFKSSEVAEIAADTMNGYLMCGRVLKCNVVSEVKPGLFRGFKNPYHRMPRRATAIAEYNKPKTREQHAKQVKRLVDRTKRKRAKLAELGVNYTFPDVHVQKATRVVFDE
ncbi:MKI67 FHA domain-interacting nucleolar phosphoprotein-like [Sycon ciliatum]|uniref:MKI67 FHA domain-interacting nucleolar phosphoprotein-like n=1 Tax=Sycon ciliatum TaxID=27933 RepID=UPI0031F5F46C